MKKYLSNYGIVPKFVGKDLLITKILKMNVKTKSDIEVGSTNYKRIGKNIYKVGNRYRVRVAHDSLYCKKLAEARNWRKVLLGEAHWDNGGNTLVKN